MKNRSNSTIYHKCRNGFLKPWTNFVCSNCHGGALEVYLTKSEAEILNDENLEKISIEFVEKALEGISDKNLFSEETISLAQRIFKKIYYCHVTADDDAIIFEKWLGLKKISIYIDNDNIECVRITNDNISYSFIKEEELSEALEWLKTSDRISSA